MPTYGNLTVNIDAAMSGCLTQINSILPTLSGTSTTIYLTAVHRSPLGNACLALVKGPRAFPARPGPR